MKKILIFCFLLTILTTNSVFAWTDNLSIGIDGYDGVYIDIYKSIAPFSSDKANLLMINNEFSDDKPPVIISGSKLKVTMYSGKTIEIVNNANLSYIDFMRLN